MSSKTIKTISKKQTDVATADVPVVAVAAPAAGKKKSPVKKTVESANASTAVSTPAPAAAQPSAESKKVKPVKLPVKVAAVTLVPSTVEAVVEQPSVKKPAAKKSPSKAAAPVKSPAKKTAAKSPVKSPAKKTAAKSPVKSPAKKTAAGKKVAGKAAAKKPAAKKGKGAKKNKSKSKRVHNTKPSTLDESGVCIGPARVRSVLMNVALNPREHAVRMALLAAENKPHKPKPTKEEPNPKMPPQGPQTPVSKLPAEELAVVREAEELHEASMQEAYERKQLSAMDEASRNAYNAKRKEAQAQAEAEKATTQFVLKDFNISFNKDFYAGYDAFKAENDGYAVGKQVIDENGVVSIKFNEWTRAVALVNKLSTRLSGNTRNLSACFADRIVEQYAMNGIQNCLLEKRRIVLLRHALAQTPGFAERVPLNPFVGTLPSYARALDWIENFHNTTEQNKQLKAKGLEEVEAPAYPDPGYEYNFEGYVGEICRSVKMRLAESVSTEAEKAVYLDASISKEFKRFCSYIVYDTILRIGASLRLSVRRSGVKTISDAMVLYVLEQIHSICGVDYTTTESNMSERLVIFNDWRAKRKQDRKNHRSGMQADASFDYADEDDEEDPDVPESVDAEEEEEPTEAEAAADDNAEAEAAEEEEESADAEESVEVEYEDAEADA